MIGAVLSRRSRISPLRTELPIDEAADAIGMARDDLWAYVAEGAVPFRSTDSVDWVDLATVIAWDNARRAARAEGIREALQEDPWEDADARPSTRPARPRRARAARSALSWTRCHPRPAAHDVLLFPGRPGRRD